MAVREEEEPVIPVFKQVLETSLDRRRNFTNSEVEQCLNIVDTCLFLPNSREIDATTLGSLDLQLKLCCSLARYLCKEKLLFAIQNMASPLEIASGEALILIMLDATRNGSILDVVNLIMKLKSYLVVRGCTEFSPAAVFSLQRF